MKVVIADYYYKDISQERQLITEQGHTLEAYRSSTEEELISRAENCDALIVQFCQVTRRVIHHLKRCKVIVRYAIGYDNIDLNAADEAGIPVCNVPDYCIDEVSTHAVMMLLACSKHMRVYMDAVHNGLWGYSAGEPIKSFSQSSVGLLGFGAISQMVAKKLSGFGVKIYAYDPYMNSKAAEELNVEPVDLDTLYACSDLISVHCPLNTKTEKMINIQTFGKMNPGVAIVNTARGGLIDEDALLLALKKGIVSAAGLDVTMQEPIPKDHPLRNDPRVIITPHIAWYSETSIKLLQKKVAQEVVRVLGGDPPAHMVNHPRGKT